MLDLVDLKIPVLCRKSGSCDLNDLKTPVSLNPSCSMLPENDLVDLIIAVFLKKSGAERVDLIIPAFRK